MDLVEGEDLDYQVNGIEVDCKWSLMINGWEIPPEMYSRGNQIALLVWGNDYTSRWAAGLLRISEDVLRPPTRQRDSKRKIASFGAQSILWIGEGDILPNTFLGLGSKLRSAILDHQSGQQCVNSLFRECTALIVNRATVLTAAQQDDCLKRVRDARKELKPEGIVIFGHYRPHPSMAEQLNLPRPSLGCFVSARLVSTTSGGPNTIELQGKRWRVANPGDLIEMAPDLPRQGQQFE